MSLSVKTITHLVTLLRWREKGTGKKSAMKIATKARRHKGSPRGFIIKNSKKNTGTGRFRAHSSRLSCVSRAEKKYGSRQVSLPPFAVLRVLRGS